MQKTEEQQDEGKAVAENADNDKKDDDKKKEDKQPPGTAIIDKLI